MKPQRKPFKPIFRPVSKTCHFCDNKNDAFYRDVEVLSKYLTERGKLMGAARSGLCAKHQRHMAKAVKQARTMGMLPFVIRAS